MTEKMLKGKMVTWLVSSAIFCINRKRDEKSKKIEDLLAVIEDLKVKLFIFNFQNIFYFLVKFQCWLHCFFLLQIL